MPGTGAGKVFECRRAVSCARGLVGREKKRLFIARSFLVEPLGWVELAFKAVLETPKGPVGLFSTLQVPCNQACCELLALSSFTQT